MLFENEVHSCNLHQLTSAAPLLSEEPNCMKDTKFSTSGLHEWSMSSTQRANLPAYLHEWSARVIPNVNVQHEWSARYQMSMFSTSGLQIL